MIPQEILDELTQRISAVAPDAKGSYIEDIVLWMKYILDDPKLMRKVLNYHLDKMIGE